MERGMIDKTAFEAARKLREYDARARALVDSAVNRAIHECGPPEERDFLRFAYDIATLATTLLLKHVYENDAELRALRIERDAYKDSALSFANLAPRVAAGPNLLAPTEAGTAKTENTGLVHEGGK